MVQGHCTTNNANLVLFVFQQTFNWTYNAFVVFGEDTEPHDITYSNGELL